MYKFTLSSRVCMYVWVHAWSCVCMYVCVHVCVCACMFTCVHVCVCACMCVYVCSRVCMYVPVCACMCVFMYVCVHAEARGHCWVSACVALHLAIWDRVCHQIWNLTIEIEWLARELQRSSVSIKHSGGPPPPPQFSAVVIELRHKLFICALGMQPSSPWLYGRHVTHWAVSLALKFTSELLDSSVSVVKSPLTRGVVFS